MASPAVSAFGTLLNLGDGATPTETFTVIAELRTISGPTLKAETIDVTTHNTATPFRRFISGLVDGGEVTFDLNFIPSDPTHSASTGVLRDLTARNRRNLRIDFPDGASTQWIIPSIVTGFQVSSDPASVLQANCTAKVAGPPTLT